MALWKIFHVVIDPLLLQAVNFHVEVPKYAVPSAVYLFSFTVQPTTVTACACVCVYVFVDITYMIYPGSPVILGFQ